jgi:hypothetical protein
MVALLVMDISLQTLAISGFGMVTLGTMLVVFLVIPVL